MDSTATAGGVYSHHPIRWAFSRGGPCGSGETVPERYTRTAGTFDCLGALPCMVASRLVVSWVEPKKERFQILKIPDLYPLIVLLALSFPFSDQLNPAGRRHVWYDFSKFLVIFLNFQLFHLNYFQNCRVFPKVYWGLQMPRYQQNGTILGQCIPQKKVV